MSVASRRPRGHAARALEEALGAVAAPAVRDGILGSALSRAGLVSIPDDGDALDRFVRGAFRNAIKERLGDDTADTVLTELWPVLAMMVSPTPRRVSARPKSVTLQPPRARSTSRPIEHTARTAPPPANDDDDDPSGVMVVHPGKTFRAGDSLPVIIAVIGDPARVRELSIQLAGRALVRPVIDLMEMAEAVEDHRAEHPVVLFDCVQPPFHLESVATFASELPNGSWLALLDPSGENLGAARTFAGSTLTVASLSWKNGIDRVALACLALFD